MAVNPLEPLAGAVSLIKGRLRPVEMVEIAHQTLGSLLQGKVEQVPIQALVVIPLVPLAEFTAHEQQLLAGHRPHEGEVTAQVGELLPAIPRHLAEQGAFAVHHFVVRDGQNEIFRKRVKEAEGQKIMMIAAMNGVLAHVAQGVVHPAHVPFVAEPESTQIRGAGDHRPGRGFFRHGHHPFMMTVDQFIHALDEIDSLKVLAAAEHVRDPLAFLATVVEIEHRGDGIDPQPVDVELLHPVKRVGEQEVTDLAPAVIEDQRIPIHVLALARIGMLVEVRAVEVDETVRVGGKVAGDPVDQNAQPFPMADIDEVFEVVGFAVAAGRREQAHWLVPPGAVERILVHRHQLDVGKPETLRIGHEIIGKFAIAQVAVALFRLALPRPQMNLVDGDRRIAVVMVSARPHPVPVLPCVFRGVGNDGPGLRGIFRFQRERIGLFRQPIAEAILQFILVDLAGMDARHENFPDAALEAAAHGMTPAIPAIEIANDTHLARVRGPNGEAGAGNAVDGHGMRTQLLEGAKVGALDQEMDVEFAEDGAEAVRVLDVEGIVAAVGKQPQAIAERLLPSGDWAGEKALLTDLRQIGDNLAGCAVNNPHLAGLWQKGTDDQLLGTV